MTTTTTKGAGDMSDKATTRVTYRDVNGEFSADISAGDLWEAAKVAGEIAAAMSLTGPLVAVVSVRWIAPDTADTRKALREGEWQTETACSDCGGRLGFPGRVVWCPVTGWGGCHL